LINQKEILHWFVRLGKVKSAVVFFGAANLLAALLLTLLVISETMFSTKTMAQLFDDQLSSLIFVEVVTGIASLSIYNDAKKMQLKIETLESKGLSLGDEQRISFIKGWQEVRKAGLRRFCLVNGGLLTGMILVFPVSILFFSLNNRQFIHSDFTGMMLFILKAAISGYFLGTAIYLIKWRYNERRFIRLTDPLHEIF
jgi:hypothetical protein